MNASFDSNVGANIAELNLLEKRLYRMVAVSDLDRKLLLGVLQNVPRLRHEGADLPKDAKIDAGQDLE